MLTKGLTIGLFISFLMFDAFAIAQTAVVSDGAFLPQADTCRVELYNSFRALDYSQLDYEEAQGIIAFYKYDASSHSYVSRGWMTAKGDPGPEIQQYMNTVSFISRKSIKAKDGCTQESEDLIFVLPLYFSHPMLYAPMGKNIFWDDPECKQLLMKFYNSSDFVVLPPVTMMRMHIKQN